MNTAYTARRLNMLFGCLFFLLALSPIRAEESDQSYGPRLIMIDDDELFRRDALPSHEPFPMYGSFLFGVANQALPMVYDTNMALPNHIEKVTDVVYKKVDGIALALDVYFNKADISWILRRLWPILIEITRHEFSRGRLELAKCAVLWRPVA